jgi:excisionase family DNA binding protein
VTEDIFTDDRRDALDNEIEHDGGLDEWARRRAAVRGCGSIQDLAKALTDALRTASQQQARSVETDAMTSDDAVAHLRLPSRKALYQLVRRGVLRPSRSIGRRMRFSRKALDAFLAGR